MLRIELVLVLLSISAAWSMSCLDENGQPVSWFAQLKYPNGGSYVYADANSPTFQKSSGDLSSTTAGSLAQTVNQIYQNRNNGYILYNDEPMSARSPLQTALNMSAVEFGHSKGILGFDSSNNAFWIVHSFPKFPSTIASGYQGLASGEQIYAQSLMCVSTNEDGLSTIGEQLQLNHPDVYDSNTPSNTPQSVKEAAEGKYDSSSNAQGRKITAIDGTVFTSFSKTGAWGKALYSDLVAPSLQAPLFAETWIRGSKIPSSCPSDGYGVKNVLALTFPPHQQFKETNDHSKWAVTADKTTQTVCIGGINQMTTQNVRGGGTVCMFQPQTWSSMMGFISAVEQC